MIGWENETDSPGCTETLGKYFHHFLHRTRSTQQGQRSQTWSPHQRGSRGVARLRTAPIPRQLAETNPKTVMSSDWYDLTHYYMNCRHRQFQDTNLFRETKRSKLPPQYHANSCSWLWWDEDHQLPALPGSQLSGSLSDMSRGAQTHLHCLV